MSRRFEVGQPLERAYTRKAMLGIELLDAVTLERVAQGIEVTAKGLTGKPIVNESGLFVWLQEDVTKLERVIVEPRAAPFERVEIAAAQVTRPLHRVELMPRASYPFSPGITAIRGSLYEKRVPLGTAPAAIAGATIRLEWLDDDGATWHPWQAPSATGAAGDFASILRLSHAQVPKLDAQEKMNVRLFAKRAAGPQKQKTFQLLQGRVADEIFAWDDLQQ
ncbi:MAG: hypothetical protein ABI580_01925 [Burkholderiaceae bacterium]